MPFCNQNGIPGLYCPNAIWKPIIPFWLQKGMKNAKFCINKIIFWEYTSRAFKIRFWNVFTTPGYDFMPYFVLIKNSHFLGGGTKKKVSHFEKSQICPFFVFFFGYSRCDSRPESAGICQIGRKLSKTYSWSYLDVFSYINHMHTIARS